MIGLFAIGVSLPRLAEAFGDEPNPRLLAQLVGGASGFAFALSTPLIARLIERHGYRNVYLAGLLAFGALGVLPMLLDNIYLIIATRCLLGIAVAGVMTAGMAGLAALPEAIRPRMFGRSAMTASMGALIFFPLTGALASVHWRLPFMIHLCALLVLPLAFAIPRQRRAAARAVEPRKPSAVPRRLSASPALVAMAAFVGLIMVIGPIFAPFYLQSIGITDPFLVALPLSTMSVASLIVTSNYGRLHARFGTTAIFAVILLLVGGGLLIAGFSTTLPLFACGMFGVSCGVAMFTPNVGAAISATADDPGRGIGLAMSAMFVVQAAFPFIGEGIRMVAGPRGVFLGFGMTALLLGLSFAIVGRRRSA